MSAETSSISRENPWAAREISPFLFYALDGQHTSEYQPIIAEYDDEDDTTASYYTDDFGEGPTCSERPEKAVADYLTEAEYEGYLYLEGTSVAQAVENAAEHHELPDDDNARPAAVGIERADSYAVASSIGPE